MRRHLALHEAVILFFVLKGRNCSSGHGDDWTVQAALNESEAGRPDLHEAPSADPVLLPIRFSARLLDNHVGPRWQHCKEGCAICLRQRDGTTLA